MKFYRKAEETAKQIVNAFREPDKLPAALAPVFIRRRDNVPCRQWSWSNQLLVALHGHSDARGFRQWQDAGRHVKKGAKSFPILCPCKKKVELTDEETGEKREVLVIYGFTTANVFGQSQTDGEPLPDPDPAMTAWLRNLPLRDVADHWGLSVETFDGDGSGYRGMDRHGQAIALGVKNLSTWCHELMHAADDRVQGGLKGGQHLDQETVAQLGASILRHCWITDLRVTTSETFLLPARGSFGKSPSAVFRIRGERLFSPMPLCTAVRLPCERSPLTGGLV